MEGFVHLKIQLRWVLAFCFVMPAFCMADNVVITKTRLIQTSETAYLLEADISKALVWAVQSPYLPERFKMSSLTYDKQDKWITASIRFETDGAPLSPGDIILLPWGTNGIALTCQWLDRNISKGVFMAGLEGIKVPMDQLIQTEQSLGAVCISHLQRGLIHFWSKGIHLLLPLILVWAWGPYAALKSLAAFFAGHGGSMVLSDAGILGPDLLPLELLFLVWSCILGTYFLRQKTSMEPPVSVFAVCGLLGLCHGLAYNVMLEGISIKPAFQLPSLFMFNIAHDVMFLLLVLAAWATKPLFSAARLSGTVLIKTMCSISLVLILILCQGFYGGKAGSIDMGRQPLISLSEASSQNTAKPTVKGTRKMEYPIMVYVSITPHEIRQEILVQTRAGVRMLDIPDEGMGGIPVQSQGAFKNFLLEKVSGIPNLIADQSPLIPVSSRIDFVTLSPAGVLVKEKPEPESLDNGILGISLTYELSGMPDGMQMTWSFFPKGTANVSFSVTDPFGAVSRVLTKDNKQVDWEPKLKGYSPPSLDVISIDKPMLSMASITFFVIGLLLLFLRSKLKRGMRYSGVVILSAGIILYPLVRIPVSLPFAQGTVPSNSKAEVIVGKLLTNVYSAFDVKKESLVYDRLSLSVTGESLAQIYLDNRKSLELENRGGARAKVDQVSIVDVRSVLPDDQGGFTVDTEWQVSGSVTHFGHTHYRRNINRANVSVFPSNGVWKIRDMEIITAKRVF